MLGPLHQNEHFFEGTHPTPLKNEISTLPTKCQKQGLNFLKSWIAFIPFVVYFQSLIV